MKNKDSSEYGWQVITRAEYERMRKHEYAGPGTPCHPNAPGYWAMSMDNDGATVLYTGVEIVEPCYAGCPDC